jgi:hypothetical protein
MAVLMHSDFSKVIMFCMSEWTTAPPRRQLGRNADVVVCTVRACCVSPCTNAAGHSRSGHACHPFPTPRRLRTLVWMRVVVGQPSVWPAVAMAAVAVFFRRNTRPLLASAHTHRRHRLTQARSTALSLYTTRAAHVPVSLGPAGH